MSATTGFRHDTAQGHDVVGFVPRDVGRAV